MVEVSCIQDMQSADLNFPIVEGCVVTLGTDEIIALLDGITSTEDEQQLDTLQRAVEAVQECSQPASVIPALFSVLERFPESDGYGVFWSILHTLEAIPGYETPLIDSVIRSPGEFNLSMVNRLLNAGITTVSPTDLKALLERVATAPGTSPSARQWARHFLSYQHGKLNT